MVTDSSFSFNQITLFRISLKFSLCRSTFGQMETINSIPISLSSPTMASGSGKKSASNFQSPCMDQWKKSTTITSIGSFFAYILLQPQAALPDYITQFALPESNSIFRHHRNGTSASRKSLRFPPANRPLLSKNQTVWCYLATHSVSLFANVTFPMRDYSIKNHSLSWNKANGTLACELRCANSSVEPFKSKVSCWY